MPDQPTTWKGTGNLEEQANSPDITWSTSGSTRTRNWTGPYAAAEAAASDFSILMTGVPAGWSLKTIHLEKEPPNKGKLTVTYEAAAIIPPEPEPDSSAASSEPQPPANIYGFDWEEVAKPIEKHERYAELNDKYLHAIELALSADEDKHRLENEAALQLEPLAFELYQKKRRGQTSYTIYAPVAKRVTYSQDQPTVTECGQIESPPGECGAPNGYEYRKSAASPHFDGTWWSLTEQWTGADEWDHDLYS